MKLSPLSYLLIFIVLLSAGCANIATPTGGKRDTIPPKLTRISPADSLLNTRVSRIEMHFNEYVTVSDVNTEVQISPLLPIPVSMLSYGKKVVAKIPDTLLHDNTTYRISFGKSIKDLHEGNPMKPYTYVFSTGSYFDSLKLNGKVIDAATGKADTGVYIMLYDASESDSAVVRKKPLYVIKTITPDFVIDGLPHRPFKMYALKDANANLVYDGKGEKIGFIDSVFYPSDTITTPITLKVFTENLIDTIKTTTDSTKTSPFKKKKQNIAKEGLLYSVNVDTSNLKKGTFDITKPLTIQFNADIDTINSGRINLSYDSSDIAVESPFTAQKDTSKNNTILITANWRESTVYTLRLLKGFARDSSHEAMPSKSIFRTKGDEDYSKMTIHLPSKYFDTKYVLLVRNDKDTVYQKPVTDTMVHLTRLAPGNYSMFVIVDENHNGKWDTGDLFLKRQPEEVIPYGDPVPLKASWENTYDFEQVKPKNKLKDAASPKRGEKSGVR